MKLPSIAQVVDSARNAFLRFPFVLIAAAIGTTGGLISADEGFYNQNAAWNWAIVASALAVAALLAFSVMAERLKWSRLLSVGGQVVICALAVGYWFTFPDFVNGIPNFHMYRFAMLAVAAVCAIAVVPWLTKGGLDSYWEFNRLLIFRLMTGALYSAVLWIGLCAALAAIDNLFGVKINAHVYLQLWIVIVGLFNTWFFLAGVPKDFDALAQSQRYPRGLKIFAQYILSIIAAAYFLILYAYIIKIVVQWNWPHGWVSGLITGYSAVGLAFLLLLWPIQTLAENKWIKAVWRWFFVFHVPLVVVLLLAIWERTGDYGITIDRYIVWVFGIWLALITLYYLVSKRQSIKFLPLSLGLVALVISVGPWGAFSVSEKSQMSRFTKLIEKNHMLIDGKVVKAEDTLSYDDGRDISSIIAYINSNYGYDILQPLVPFSLKDDSANFNGGRMEPMKVAQMLNFEYVGPYGMQGEHYVWKNVRMPSNVDLRGYDHMVRGLVLNAGQHRDTILAEEVVCSYDSSGSSIVIARKDGAGSADSVSVDFGELLTGMGPSQQGGKQDNPPQDSLALTGENGRLRIKLLVSHISGQWSNRKFAQGSVNFDLLYTISDRTKP